MTKDSEQAEALTDWRRIGSVSRGNTASKQRHSQTREGQTGSISKRQKTASKQRHPQTREGRMGNISRGQRASEQRHSLAGEGE